LPEGEYWANGIDASMMQAKNVVLNVSEMEAKVREATNDDPW
jgi:epsin